MPYSISCCSMSINFLQEKKKRTALYANKFGWRDQIDSFNKKRDKIDNDEILRMNWTIKIKMDLVKLNLEACPNPNKKLVYQ